MPCCPYSLWPDILSRLDSNEEAVISICPIVAVGIAVSEIFTMTVGRRFTTLETNCCRTLCSSKHRTRMREDMAMNIRKIGKNAADCMERWKDMKAFRHAWDVYAPSDFQNLKERYSQNHLIKQTDRVLNLVRGRGNVICIRKVGPRTFQGACIIYTWTVERTTKVVD